MESEKDHKNKALVPSSTVTESEKDDRNKALVPSSPTVLLFCLLAFSLLNGCIKQLELIRNW